MFRGVCLLAMMTVFVQGATAACVASDAGATVTCTGDGTPYPLTLETAFAIPAPDSVTKIIITKYSIAKEASVAMIQPLPTTLTKLTTLTFITITGDAPFPLGQITGALSKKITELTLNGVTLPNVAEDALTDFGELVTLSLNNNGIVTIGTTTLMGAPKIKTLSVTNEAKLAAIPWNVLSTVKSTLTTLTLSDLGLLTSIAKPTPALALPALAKLVVTNTALAGVQEAVTETLKIATQKVEVTFTGNNNPCTSCDNIKPLLAWIRTAAPTTNAESVLTVTCKPTSGEVPRVSGKPADWIARPNDGCISDTTVAPPTVAPTTAAPSTASAGTIVSLSLLLVSVMCMVIA